MASRNKQQPSATPAKLLFLPCEGVSGKPKDHKRKALRRHVQLDFRLKSSSEPPTESTTLVPACSGDVQLLTDLCTSAITSVHRSRAKRQSTSECHPVGSYLYSQPDGFDPFSTFAATEDRRGDEAHEMLQLLIWHESFATQEHSPASTSPSYLTLIVQMAWNLAKGHKGYYHALMAFVLKSQQAITGGTDRQMYYRHRGLAIQHLQQVICSSTAPRGLGRGENMVATAMMMSKLADLAMFEYEDKERLTHEVSIRKMRLVIEESLQDPNLHGLYWFGVVSTSLRNGMRSNDAPWFSYYVHPACRFDSILADRPDLRLGAHKATTKVVGHLPFLECGRDLDQSGMFSVFQLMFLHAGNTANIKPEHGMATMGLLYHVAYELATRVFEAQRLLRQPAHEQSTEAVFCILLVSQLSIWALSGLSIHPKCRPAVADGLRVLRRVVDMLAKRHDLILYWRTSATLDALVWVLFICCAYTTLDLTDGTWLRAVLRPMLAKTLNEMGVENVDRLRKIVEIFPWLESWSARKVEEVWGILGRL